MFYLVVVLLLTFQISPLILHADELDDLLLETKSSPEEIATDEEYEYPPVRRERKRRIGEVYTIVEGDTLWDISERFLNSPWYWPKIWKLNSYIKNPHLIYPGDTVRFDFSARRGPSIALVSKKKIKHRLRRRRKRRGRVDYSVLEREIPPSKFDKYDFYIPSYNRLVSKPKHASDIDARRVCLGKAPEFPAQLYASSKDLSFLTSGDSVEIKLARGRVCKKGERYIAVESEGNGIYKIIGTLEVVGKASKLERCLAKIDKIYDLLRRDTKLTNPLFTKAKARRIRDTITGRVYSMSPSTKVFAAEGESVFIKFNAPRAPRPGTVIYFYEIVDPQTGREIDPFVIAMAKLIHSSGQYATAFVLASRRPITKKSSVTTRF